MPDYLMRGQQQSSKKDAGTTGNQIKKKNEVVPPTLFEKLIPNGSTAKIEKLKVYNYLEKT